MLIPVMNSWSLHNFLPFWLVLIIMMNIIIISLVDTLHLLDGGISFWIPKLVQKGREDKVKQNVEKLQKKNL